MNSAIPSSIFVPTSGQPDIPKTPKTPKTPDIPENPETPKNSSTDYRKLKCPPAPKKQHSQLSFHNPQYNYTKQYPKTATLNLDN